MRKPNQTRTRGTQGGESEVARVDESMQCEHCSGIVAVVDQVGGDSIIVWLRLVYAPIRGARPDVVSVRC